MIITGEIKEVSATSYVKEGKVINQKLVRIEYDFYRFVTTICFIASDNLVIPADFDQLYNFEFEIKTKYVNDKVFTDFILKNVTEASQIGEDNFLVVVKTNFEKSDLEILKTEEIKGRLKHIAVLKAKKESARDIYAYYWEDNNYLKDLKEVNLLQLNCKSLPYQNRWINNIEIWRTIENDNFLGSII